MTIPVIDIGPFLHGSPEDRRSVARQVDEALRRIGFFAVTGHGVDGRVVDAMTRGSAAFFDLPLQEKMKSAHPGGSIGRGYVPYGGESNGRTLNAAAQPDAKEQIAFGRFDIPDADYYRQDFARIAFQPNLLPASPAGYARVARDYFGAMEALSQRMLHLFAHALELEPAFFADKFTHHASVMRVLNYPDQSGIVLAPGQLRSGAHTDFGILTLLLADDAPGGLQVKRRDDGGWVDVVPPRDSFVVNIGDLMAIWTNDRWVSNLHRVANPAPVPGQGTRRQSIAFFVHANYDARIECIPTCASEQQPPRHAPVLAGEHRLMKVRKASETPYAAASLAGAVD